MRNLVVLLGGYAFGLGVVAIMVRLRAAGGWGGVQRSTRRFLRRQNVLSQLAVAGVALSTAALLLLIGTSEVQIQSAHDGSQSLVLDPWFDVGLVLGAIGVFWAGIAIAANRSQAEAMNEFPNLEIDLNGWTRSDGMRMLRPGTEIPVRLYGFHVRIVSRESNRVANLTPTLFVATEPGSLGELTEIGLGVPDWDITELFQATMGILPSKPMPQPVEVPYGAGVIIQGTLYFEAAFGILGALPEGDADLKRLQWIDHFSQRVVEFPTTGGRYGQENWVAK